MCYWICYVIYTCVPVAYVGEFCKPLFFKILLRSLCSCSVGRKRFMYVPHICVEDAIIRFLPIIQRKLLYYRRTDNGTRVVLTVRSPAWTARPQLWPIDWTLLLQLVSEIAYNYRFARFFFCNSRPIFGRIV